jgi:hypothetical protein
MIPRWNRNKQDGGPNDRASRVLSPTKFLSNIKAGVGDRGDRLKFDKPNFNFKKKESNSVERF